MKMKRSFFALAAVLVFFCGVGVYAETDYAKLTQEGGEAVLDSLRDEDRNEAEDLSENFGIPALWNYIKETVVGNAIKPIKILVFTAALVVFERIVSSLCERESKGVQLSLDTLCCICVSIMVSDDVFSRLGVLSDTAHSCEIFLEGSIPVFAGLMISSGLPTAAVLLDSVIFGAANLISTLITNIIAPTLFACASFALISGVSASINLSAFADAILKIIAMVLSAALTLFVGIITLQSFAAVSTDSIALSAGKFIAGNFVPVIGGALSDSVSTLFSCLGVVKSSVGIIGIAGVLVIFVPPMAECGVYCLTFALSGAFAEAFGVEKVKRQMKTLEKCFGIYIAVLAAYALMLIISVALMLFLNNKGGG